MFSGTLSTTRLTPTFVCLLLYHKALDDVAERLSAASAGVSAGAPSAPATRRPAPSSPARAEQARPAQLVEAEPGTHLLSRLLLLCAGYVLIAFGAYQGVSIGLRLLS